DAVRSQGPPTKTRKGSRPSRRGDNPDWGLPSGKDVPDGRRYGAPVAMPPPKRTPVYPPAKPVVGRPGDNTDRGLPSGADVPDNRARTRSGPPPPNRKTYAPPAPVVAQPPRKSYGPPPPYRRPAGRPGDNTDVGLPSGADVPDNRARTKSGPPPTYRVFPAATKAPVYVPPPVPMNAYVPPPVPVNAYVPPAFPTLSCNALCDLRPEYKPVCDVNGDQYDNDCYRTCAGVARACENSCPCNGPAPVDPYFPPVPAVSACEAQCSGQEYDPVCVDGEEVLKNECVAICEGASHWCGGTCPCSK
ncbi:hypothetical protein MAR_016828, partial [Mya arenaria]